MKEFISILISFIFMGIADSIDSAFNNLISIDTIIVCSSLFSIELILKSISEIGIFTYRTIRKDEWSYLWINIIISFILGIIVFLFKDILVNIFTLTVYQKDLFSQVLSLYIVYLVIGRFANALYEIIRLKGNLKLYRNSLILFYILLIGLDSLAYFTTKNLILLFCATMISWLVAIIYMLYNSKLKFMFPNKETINKVIKYGVPISLERLLSRIFILIYGVIASSLGTNDYAIHAICYGVCLNLEIVTNAYQAALMIKVPEGKTVREQFDICMKFRNKFFALIVLLNFSMSIVYLLILHGSLPLNKCFPYIIFYSMCVFGLYPYETYKTLCITQGKPKILLFGSITGVIVRIIFCLIFLKSPIVLFVFGLSNLIDFYTRSRVYKYGLSKEIINYDTEIIL